MHCIKRTKPARKYHFSFSCKDSGEILGTFLGTVLEKGRGTGEVQVNINRLNLQHKTFGTGIREKLSSGKYSKAKE